MYQHYKGDKMNRCERRYRTQKIAKKRFQEVYCGYNGKPTKWFLRYSKKEQEKCIGKCRNRITIWRCKCEWCLGSVVKLEEISNINFNESLNDAIRDKKDFRFLMSNKIEKTKATHADIRAVCDGGYHWPWSLKALPKKSGRMA
jgi:hypothetical protein